MFRSKAIGELLHVGVSGFIECGSDDYV